MQQVPSRGHLFNEFGRPKGQSFKILHTCSFENHASQRRRGALFQKNDENSVEKSGLNRINTNGTVDGTRNAHPRGPKKQKYTFLQWILQILVCNRYRQHGTFSVTLGWQNECFLKILLTCNFQNYASHLRRGAQFQKNVRKLQEEGVLSHKMDKKKPDDARKTKKIRCVADSRFC